jgi:hypothetical protein
MNHDLLDDILDHEDEWVPIRSYWRRNAFREVFRYRDDTVVKRFTFPWWFLHAHRPWWHEHEGLQRLRGLGFPASHGYRRKPRARRWVVRYARAFLPGRPVPALSREDMPGAADLFALMHKHGCICNDPSLANFVFTDEGSLRCIDFGRAWTFHRWSPALPIFIGREFARFWREGLQLDANLWQAFWPLYARRAGWSRFALGQIERSLRATLRARARRHEPEPEPPRSSPAPEASTAPAR